MPTAPKALAAFCLAVLGYLASELVKTLVPEITNFGNFSYVNMALGALVGWIVVGKRAGRGTKEAIGNGLTGMTERLRQLGGKLEIESEPGAGFALHAWLPTKV